MNNIDLMNYWIESADEYTEKQLENIEEVRKWLKSLLTM